MKYLTIAVVGIFVFASLTLHGQTNTNHSKKSESTSSVKQNENPVSAFKKRNKDVKSVKWKQGNFLIIEKVNGHVEEYNLQDAEAVKKAEALYGELPTIPPPPPPIPAPPPPPVLPQPAPSIPSVPPTPPVPPQE